ncbi:MAG: DUF1566 domain-containing protein [Campylobacterota bacterium]|nr:DUF1566 domain-containing protein [Campylobacterota bacterium]
MKMDRFKNVAALIGVTLFISGCGSSSDSQPSETTNKINNSVETITQSYKVADTNQQKCFDSNGIQITCSNTGQDGSYITNVPSYSINNSYIVTDNITALMWTKSADINNDGYIDVSDKKSQTQAVSYCQELSLEGYDDWRLPDIKTLYSLMDFSGGDPSGYNGTDTSELKPFIDNSVFEIGYGDTSAGERVIDAQWATTTKYVSTTMNGDETMFGLNLADGRIKGYPVQTHGSDKLFYVQCVRENENYGKNSFKDNGDDTITDNGTNLTWQKNDNANKVDWDGALSYCENLTLGGSSFWRLPNAKELHTIVDYTKSPDTDNSPAIDTEFFNSSSIINEEGEDDFGSYWSSTTHKTYTNQGSSAVYISFGRALGYMNNQWLDVHGAGAQRSDPKDISLLNTNDPSYTIVGDTITHGPQGDVVRGMNFVRCVRD